MPRSARFAYIIAFSALVALFGSATLNPRPVRFTDKLVKVAETQNLGKALDIATHETQMGVGASADAGADKVRNRDSDSSGTAGRIREMKVHGRDLRNSGRPLNRNHPQVARVMRVKARNLDLMNHPQVTAMAVGLNAKSELAIVVYTTIDGVRLPRSIEGVPVDVRKSGEIFAGRKRVKAAVENDAYNARWSRPVPIGVSTGHPSITAGTIGCRLTDGTNVFALSNNHVYADENQAGIGNAVIQPGTFDNGSSPSDNIGTLSDFEPLQFGGPPHNPQNTIDAAIAATTSGDLDTTTPAGLSGYGTPSSAVVTPALTMAVTKVGRTTGHTFGTIDAIDATVTVRYDSGRAHFNSQFIVVPGAFSDGGDSGSLIVTHDGNNNPVGLLYAGSSSHTIANDIQDVLDRFAGLSVDDTPSSGNAAPVVTITAPADGANPSSGASITFSGTAIDDNDGDITASLTWESSIDGTIGSGGSFSATLGDGIHTITASATDSESATGNAAITITVGTITTPTMVIVDSVTYGTAGGKNGTKNLRITVALVDDFGDPVSGASVSIATDNTTTGASATGTASTGSDGTVTFQWRNAPSGDYETTVTDVSASGLTWDGVTPPNGFTK